MDHCFYGVCIQLIDRNGIIVMNKRPDDLIDGIAKKEWLVVKIDFDIHDDKDKIQGTRLKAHETRCKKQDPACYTLGP